MRTPTLVAAVGTSIPHAGQVCRQRMPSRTRDQGISKLPRFVSSFENCLVCTTRSLAGSESNAFYTFLASLRDKAARAAGVTLGNVMDLLVAGDLNADIVLSGVEWPRIGVERIAEAGSLALGGSAGICAANAARLGLRVRLAAVVGDDALGQILIEKLRLAGVDTSAIRVAPRLGTGFTVVINAQDRTEKALLTWPGALAELRASDVRPLLDGSRHLHCCSYFLMTRMQKGLPLLFRAARKHGITTSLDPNPDPAGTYDSGIVAALAEADTFFPNRMEAEHITGTRGGPATFRRLATMTHTTVLKNGGDGVVYLSAGVQIRHFAPPAQVVDPTGAGESFEAGFLAARLRNADLHDALRFGQDCAAAACAVPGGTAAFEDPGTLARLRRQLDAIAQAG